MYQNIINFVESIPAPDHITASQQHYKHINQNTFVAAFSKSLYSQKSGTPL